MDSGTDDDALFGHGLHTLGVFVFGGDGKVLTTVTRQRPAQRSSVEEVVAVRIFLYPCQIFLEVGVGVRIAM